MIPSRRDSLFAGLPSSFTVSHWHRDTFHAPTGTVQLANSHAHQNQAVRVGGLSYALRFHLEATPSMVRGWVHEYGREIDELGRVGDQERTLEETPARCEALRSVSREVFSNFHRLARLRAMKPEAPTADRQREENARGGLKDPKMERAWQRYREFMARGKLRCGVTCPLDRIGRCTGGCW